MARECNPESRFLWQWLGTGGILPRSHPRTGGRPVPEKRNACRFTAILAALTVLVVACAGIAQAGLLAIGQGDFRLYDVNTSTASATNSRNVGNKVNMISFSPTGMLYG